MPHRTVTFQYASYDEPIFLAGSAMRANLPHMTVPNFQLTSFGSVAEPIYLLPEVPSQFTSSTNVELAPFTAFFVAEAAHDDRRTVSVLAVHDAVWLASLDCESTTGGYDRNFILNREALDEKQAVTCSTVVQNRARCLVRARELASAHAAHDTIVRLEVIVKLSSIVRG
eukprot:COSAG01_NODE_1527_length_10015_cov_79.013312_7_plen_170_part_00